VFIDDKPVFAGYMWGGGPTVDEYAEAANATLYAEAGVHWHAFDVGMGLNEWCGPQPGRESHFDFSTVVQRFGRVIDADPDARFHLRVHLETHGQWWRELYPEECELGSDGVRRNQSFASVLWREQTKQFLREYVTHIYAVGLGDRVIAYQTGAGATGEWVKDTAMERYCGDYSEPMRQHFRAWLRERYQGDLGSLRAAWNNDVVTFDNAEVPSAEEQHRTQAGGLRDPRKERSVIDYYACLGELCGGLVSGFCQTVKEASQGRALAGAFFGYLPELAWNSSFFGGSPDSDISAVQRSGHLGLAVALRSPHVDFIVSPYSYGFRGIGGHGPAMPPSESLRLHNKLYLFEEDSRVCTAQDQDYGRVYTVEHSIAVLQRNMAEVVTRGQGIWWLGPHMRLDQEPSFRPVIQRFQDLGNWATTLDRRPSAEIAVLLDDESYLYESIHNDLDLPLIFQQRLWGLPKLGAPADHYLLQDLIEGNVPPYKVYIMLNAFHLDARRRERLARQLHREGKVVVWLYAPGYLQDEPGLEHMRDLTGITFDKGDHAWGPLVHILDFEHPITRDLSQDLFWGTNARINPVFHVEDPAARTLGQVVYSQGRCKPGFVLKEFPEWSSVYSAAPNLPAPVLRGIARWAGVHIYNDQSDVLYAARELLAVHTVAGGEREFVLPGRVEVVYDLYGAREIAAHTDRFAIDLPKESSHLYYIGDRAKLATLPEFRMCVGSRASS
jgi:hypothetical protein